MRISFVPSLIVATWSSVAVGCASGPRAAIAPPSYVPPAAESDGIETGYGRLRVVAHQGQPVGELTFTKIVGGFVERETITAGWVGPLSPGIYAVSNGDHIAIREGFETRYVPGNPAALVISGRRFPLDDLVRTVTPADPGGTSLEWGPVADECLTFGSPCSGTRYFGPGQPVDLNDLTGIRSIVHQAVFHADRSRDMPALIRELVEAGLSTHLAIDEDGTIHQLVDLVGNAYHAREGNARSVAVTLRRGPSAASTGATGRSEAPPADSSYDTNHGLDAQADGFTEAQWRATLAVSRLLIRVFPALAPSYPQDAKGRPDLSFSKGAGAFSGFLGHHAWDAGWTDPNPAFDWIRLAKAFGPLAAP